MKLVVVVSLLVALSLFAEELPTTCSALHQLLGKTWSDPAVESLIGDSEGILSSGSPWTKSEHAFPEHGFSVVVSDPEIIAGIRYYNGTTPGYRGFQGELPAGLKTSMSRREVEAILGPGKRISARDGIRLWKEYRINRNPLLVAYATADVRDMNAGILALHLYLKRYAP